MPRITPLMGRGPVPETNTRFVEIEVRRKPRLEETTVPTSFSNSDRTVEAVLSVGAAVRREYGMEVLEISPQAISLERVKAGGIPVLDSHNAHGIDSALGRINDVWIEGKSLNGRIRFNETEQGEKARGMVQRGELKHLSIGYRVDDWSITDGEGREVNPEYVRWDDTSLTYTGKKWELLETSLVTVPADYMAAVRSAEAARTESAPPARELSADAPKKASKPSSKSTRHKMDEDNRGLPRSEMAPLTDKNDGNEDQNIGSNKKAKVDAESSNTSYKGGSKQARAKKDDEDEWEKNWDEDEKRARDDDPEDEEDEETDKKRKRTRATDQEDDDDGDETQPKRKRKGRATDDDMELPPIKTSRSARVNAIEIAEIAQQFRALGVEVDVARALSNNMSPDAVRKRAINMLSRQQEERAPGPRTSTSPVSLQVMRDEREGRAEAMELALVQNVLDSGGYGGHDKRIAYEPKGHEDASFAKRYEAQARQYRGLGLVGIAAECINYRPPHSRQFITASDAMNIFTRAFNTTSDFPNIFQNVLNKSLLARYELHMPTYRELSVERPFNDFRPHPQIRAGEFPTLQSVSETGELKYGSTADTGENVSVTPYGVIFSISRTMLVNDDLGAIDQMLGSAGDAVLVFENTTWFTMLLSGTSANGPTLLQDGLQVFNSTAVTAGGHGNLASPGAAPSITTLATARQALRQMKSIQGLFLNVPPRIILTGPIQETNADQMITNITPTLTTSVNPFSGRLRSVSDANITDDSWYMFAEPTRLPSFVHGFLRGAGGPRVRTFEPFGVQGIKISLEHDFATGAIDFRSVYKSPSF